MTVRLNGRVFNTDMSTQVVLNGARPIKPNGLVPTSSPVGFFDVTWNGNHFYPPPSGSVLYLPGYPGQGSVITDYSGQGNHGTIAGASWAMLPSGIWYLSGDGVDDWVDCGSGASLDNIAVKTITAWIYVNAGSTWWRIATKAEQNDDGWLFTYDPSYLSFGQDFATTNGRWNTPANSILEETWYLVAVVYDRALTTNDPIIYINGVSQVITEVSTPVGTVNSDAASPLYVGARQLAGVAGGFFNGRIAFARLYNRAITLDEIAGSFYNEKHLFGL